MGSTKPAVFLERQLVRGGPLILSGSVIAALALAAGQRNNDPHNAPLFEYLAYDSGAYCATAFTDGKPEFFFHGNRGDQVTLNRYVVTRHHHLCAL